LSFHFSICCYIYSIISHLLYSYYTRRGIAPRLSHQSVSRDVRSVRNSESAERADYRPTKGVDAYVARLGGRRVCASHVASRFFLTPRTNAHGMLKWIPSSRADGGAIQLLWDFTTTLKRGELRNGRSRSCMPACTATYTEICTSRLLPAGCSAVRQKRASVTPTVGRSRRACNFNARARAREERTRACSVSR